MAFKNGIFQKTERNQRKEVEIFFNLEENFDFGNLFRFLFVFLYPKFEVMEQKNLNRLRVIIAEKNLTNKWLSEQLGVGQATISKWVQNNAQPNLEMLIKLSKLLDVDINELVRPEEVSLDK